jgi:hypothetical protein
VAEDRPSKRVVQSGITAQGTSLGSEAILNVLSETQQARYQDERAIARGGMGEVEIVVDRTLERPTARKLLHRELQSDPRQLEMFMREARITGQLEHPNIVPVHELGVTDGRRLYFTMKLVQGRTLEERITSLPPGVIPRGELLDLIDVVVKVCDALAYAHSHGVLHCDVKPANVMVGEYGEVYLMDWGVAQSIRDAEHDEKIYEPEGTVVGTPSHMPPEQARGEPLDARADVFAIGALVYHIVTRRPPFAGDNLVQAIAASYLCRFPHPDEVIGPGVLPAELVRIVLKAMSKELADRYPTIRELRDDLVRYIRGGESFPIVRVAAGEVIMLEGDEGDAAYIIERGRCEVTKAGAVIRTMGVGEVFGEMAVLSPGRRTATVTALEDCELRRVTADTLRSELASMKPWMGAIVRTLADRFREREEK